MHHFLTLEALKSELWSLPTGQQQYHHLTELPKYQPKAKLHREWQPLHDTHSPQVHSYYGTTSHSKPNIPPGTQPAISTLDWSVIVLWGS